MNFVLLHTPSAFNFELLTFSWKRQSPSIEITISLSLLNIFNEIINITNPNTMKLKKYKMKSYDSIISFVLFRSEIISEII